MKYIPYSTRRCPLTSGSWFCIFGPVFFFYGLYGLAGVRGDGGELGRAGPGAQVVLGGTGTLPGTRAASPGGWLTIVPASIALAVVSVAGLSSYPFFFNQ